MTNITQQMYYIIDTCVNFHKNICKVIELNIFPDTLWFVNYRIRVDERTAAD